MAHAMLAALTICVVLLGGTEMNLGQRIRAAFGLIVKGSIAPWDQIIGELQASGAPMKLDQPYRKSVWVSRAIKHVFEPVTSVPLRFSSDMRGGTRLVTDERLAAYWEAPAVGPEGPWPIRDVIAATIGWSKLAGEAFWIFDDTVLVPFPEAREVFPRFIIARPDRMTEIKVGNKLEGWRFTDGSKRQIVLLPEQVIHLKLWNPYDDIRGLSEYDAARVAAEGDYLAGNFKLNVMRSNGDQGVFVVAKGQLTDPQRKQIIEGLREKRELQARGQFRPAFLTGDITIEDPKIKSVDLAFVEARLGDRHEIYVAFGVPPSMADVVPSYSVGSASDYYRLIRDTCIPAGTHFCESVDAVNMRLLTSRIFAWFDWSDHPVMREVRREATQTAVAYWDRGVSWQILNEMLDLGMPQFEGWDRAYLPFSVSPAGEQADSSLDFGADFDEEEDDTTNAQNDPVLEMVQALKSARAKGRSPSEVRLWKAHMRARETSGKMYVSKIRAELAIARREVLQKIDKAEAAHKGERSFWPMMKASEFTFDLSAFSGRLETAMNRAARTALNTAGQQLFDEVKHDEKFSMPESDVTTFNTQRQNKIKGASEDIWNDVRGAIQEGIDAGEPTEKIASRVRAAFNGISQGRARRIAVTEMGVAYGVARDEGMRQAGIEAKEWLSSGDARVRDAHMIANGQVVPVDGKFFVDGEYLEHPGDPAGSPGNTINCRCVSIPAKLEDQS